MKPIRLAIVALLLFGPALGAATQVSPARPMRVKVAAEQANLREKPDIGSSIVQQIPEGVVLEADRKEGEWYFVRYTLEDGGVIGGWIHESLVEAAADAAPAPEPGKPEPGTAGEERGPRPVRTGRIRMPELSTGSFPLEFSISAGAGSISPGDLNDGTAGYADYIGAVLGVAAPGSPADLSLAYLIGFELSYRASSRLAIGFGADYFRGANRDALEYAGALATETLVTRPSARAVPVKLMVRYYPGGGFYLRGGLGIYAVKVGYLYRHVGEDDWRQWKGTATGNGLGAEAAFGGEWKIAPKTSFFVEAGLRLASFGGLTGKSVYTNSDGDSLTEPGTLYFFRAIAPDANVYPLLFVRETAPDEEDVVDYRRARLNLSGTAVRAGLRFRF